MTDLTIAGAIAALGTASVALADAEQARATLEIEKQEHEAALVASFIGNDNPNTGKPHSQSSAEKAASEHESIVAYRRRRIDAERAVTLARGTYEIARVRAWYVARQLVAEVA